MIMLKSQGAKYRIRRFGPRLNIFLAVIAMATLMSASVAKLNTDSGEMGAQAVCDAEAGGPRLVAMEAAPAPLEIGGTYAKIIASSINGSGEAAFSASLSGSATTSAIFLCANGETRAIVRSGDEAPGGGNYSAFGELDLTVTHPAGGNMNLLMFRAEIEGGPGAEGIFLWSPEGVQEIALAGEQSPRGNTYKSFSALSIVSVSPTEGHYKRAFVAAMENNKKSVMFKASYDQLFEILTTGDVLQPKRDVVEDFVIGRLGFSLGCVIQAHRKSKINKHYKKVIILDGFLVTGDALRDGVRFPVLGKVKQIFDPPAMNFQQAYASIEFKSGVSALATRDVDGGSSIIAKSGDTTTEAPSEVIQNFGPPVSSPFREFTSDDFGEVSGPFGIVSPVHLHADRVALWLGVFTSKIPSFVGGTRVLLTDGRVVLDGQEVTLVAFSPVKLTNTGILLVRGKLGDGEQTRECLFTIGGLFDKPSP
jgi:hypothetical protein